MQTMPVSWEHYREPALAAMLCASPQIPSLMPATFFRGLLTTTSASLFSSTWSFPAPRHQQLSSKVLSDANTLALVAQMTYWLPLLPPSLSAPRPTNICSLHKKEMLRANCGLGRTLSVSWRCSSVTARPMLLQGLVSIHNNTGGREKKKAGKKGAGFFQQTTSEEKESRRSI